MPLDPSLVGLTPPSLGLFGGAPESLPEGDVGEGLAPESASSKKLGFAPHAVSSINKGRAVRMRRSYVSRGKGPLNGSETSLLARATCDNS